MERGDTVSMMFDIRTIILRSTNVNLSAPTENHVRSGGRPANSPPVINYHWKNGVIRSQNLFLLVLDTLVHFYETLQSAALFRL